MNKSGWVIQNNGWLGFFFNTLGQVRLYKVLFSPARSGYCRVGAQAGVRQ